MRPDNAQAPQMRPDAQSPISAHTVASEGNTEATASNVRVCLSNGRWWITLTVGKDTVALASSWSRLSADLAADGLRRYLTVVLPHDIDTTERWAS